MAAANLHFGIDIRTNPLNRAVGLIKDVGRLQPNMKNILYHPAIKRFFSGEIIV